MIYLLYFTAAVILLVLGHFFRTKRWKQFIMIYERSDDGQLLQALAVGYTINFFIPFRAGDIVRAVVSGRKLKNGVSFSLSTIVIEYLLDIPIVGLIFLALHLLNFQNTNITNMTIFYGVLAAAGVIMAVAAINFSGNIKALMKSVCSIFNDRIEYGLLFFLWSLITSFRNVFVKVSKAKIILYSVYMWMIYLLSYFCFTNAVLLKEPEVRFTNIFSMIFSQGGFNLFSLNNASELLSENRVDMIVYIACSLVMLFCLTFVLRMIKKYNQDNGGDEKREKPLNLLPWINEKDRLNFLESYFSAESSDKLKKYIESNRDIHILQDLSAGSNATTMLCMDGENMFYRKYALGGDGDKLYEQVLWLRAHEHVLPLPVIINQQNENGYCIYDMEYNSGAIGLFNYMHSTSNENSWRIMRQALDDLSSNLHSMNRRSADKESITRYINSKVILNLSKMENSKELRHLMEYDMLIINGREYRNMPYLKKWLKIEYLEKVFENDEYSDIHGDLTVENLIFFENNARRPYYFIDPNTGNIHDSPALDYGKLLQSLHGSYEFLMRTEKVNVKHNQITFMAAGSQHYADIYKRYHCYLKERFAARQMRSIYFHEVIHWLRLMPYKVDKEPYRAPLFYAGLIKIFNEAVKWYGEDIV